MTERMLLRAEALTKYYGEFRALHAVNLGVGAGEFVSIIGPNGAGKSTLINLLTGLAQPTSGTVRFKDRDITGIGPVRLAKLGMARSFQLVQIFPDLTVLETLQAAVAARLGRGRRLFASLTGDRDCFMRRYRLGVRQTSGICRAALVWRRSAWKYCAAVDG